MHVFVINYRLPSSFYQKLTRDSLRKFPSSRLYFYGEKLQMMRKSQPIKPFDLGNNFSYKNFLCDKGGFGVKAWIK